FVRPSRRAWSHEASSTSRGFCVRLGQLLQGYIGSDKEGEHCEPDQTTQRAQEGGFPSRPTIPLTRRRSLAALPPHSEQACGAADRKRHRRRAQVAVSFVSTARH